MAYRAATGRKIAVESRPKDVRAVMRRHLREEGVRIVDLAAPWNMHPTSVYRRFYDKRPFTPAHVQSFAEFLKLDADDTRELHHLGALESGWRIGPYKNV